MPRLSVEVQDLIGSCADITAEGWAAALSTYTAGIAAYTQAMAAAKPSASEVAAVQKQARDTLRPHADLINAAGPSGTFGDVMVIVRTAAYATLKRAQLTTAQHDVLIAPLVAAGVGRSFLSRNFE